MGHDIYGFNKVGEQIAYARFSMGNYNALTLYNLLDAGDFYAGVSGSGDSTTYSIQQMEQALAAYRKCYKHVDTSLSEASIGDWDQKQILIFIKNCLVSAQKEGDVNVYFG